MLAGKNNFELPNYELIRQQLIDLELSSLGKNSMLQVLESDKKNDKELLQTQVFENFFKQNSDNSRKKVLLVISGSYMEGDDRSQSYPNYLKEMAKSNLDCDFLVLNIDPHFTTNLSPVGSTQENVNLKFLKGHLNPVKNPQFYSEIGNHLYRFDKVVFCSHTCEVGALDFHSLHRHCQKQDIDCVTIGAYWNRSPCCIIKEPLIEQDHVYFSYFQKIHFFIDRNLIPKEDIGDGFQDSQKILKLPFVFNFLDIDFGSSKTDENKKEIVEEKKWGNQYKSIELFTGIEDENFIKAIDDFIHPERSKPLPAQFAIIGAGVGVIAGLACVSTLRLGIVSVPSTAVIASTTIAGATAFYLINQAIKKNNHQK